MVAWASSAAPESSRDAAELPSCRAARSARWTVSITPRTDTCAASWRFLESRAFGVSRVDDPSLGVLQVAQPRCCACRLSFSMARRAAGPRAAARSISVAVSGS